MNNVPDSKQTEKKHEKGTYSWRHRPYWKRNF